MTTTKKGGSIITDCWCGNGKEDMGLGAKVTPSETNPQCLQEMNGGFFHGVFWRERDGFTWRTTLAVIVSRRGAVTSNADGVAVFTDGR